MKLLKKISLILILSLMIYIILAVCRGFTNKVYAAGYISLEEAERKMPGVTDLVNNLKANHQYYDFQFYDTGLDWNISILREYQGHGHSPTNLFNFGTKYSGMWYCPVCGTKVYDNSSLSCASQEAIKYMMDPRNSLTEESVFQFKSLEVADASYDDIARVCSGTFLNDGECVQAIFDASCMYNVNAFYLVAKILTEQGTNGSTLSRGVVVNGTTYYNLFNVGAFGNKTEVIITNGANYAASQGWNSRRASILGGAQAVKANYIGKGQNTCYYQKYNVVNTQSGLYNHQYAQNILAAENEGRKFRTYYNVNGSIFGAHTFIIPVYSGMPASACSRPSTSTKNSINYETGRITANGGVKVRAWEGTGMEQIGSIAQNATVKIISRGSVPADGYYWDLVISDSDGTYGFVARNYIATTGSGSNSGANTDTEYVDTNNSSTNNSTSSQQNVTTDTGTTMLVKGNAFVVSSNLTIQDIQKVHPSAVILDHTGAVSINVCTGYTITIGGGTYVLVKKGDVNGDGEIDISDIVFMLNHIKQTGIITDDAQLEAATVSGETEISVTDVVKELNYIKKSLKDILVR